MLKKVSLFIIFLVSLSVITAYCAEISISTFMFDDITSTVYISGKITPPNNKTVFIRVSDESDNIVQLETAFADASGDWSFSYKVSATGRYTINLGGTAVQEFSEVSFKMLSESEKTGLLASINSPSITTAQLKSILENNLEELSLNIVLLNKFNSFSEEADRTIVLAGIINDSRANNFSSALDVQNSFIKNMKIPMAREAVNLAVRETILSVLTEYKDTLNLDLTGSYARLSDAGKTEVAKGMTGNNFKTIGEIKEKFDALVSEELSKTTIITPPGNSGGGGSNSGGGGGVSTITAAPNYVDREKPVKGFSDISDVEWAKDAILDLYNKGIVSGVSENEFAPDRNVLREEFVKMLVEAFNLKDENAECDFNDVDKSSWYYLYIASAKKAGILNGFSDNTAGIGMEISRQDLAVMSYRAILALNKGLPPINSPADFSDQNEISDYALTAVQNMQRANIINGMGNNNFAPRLTATRAQAAKIIFGLIN